MRAILCCPPFSAGIERLFSSVVLVLTKLRSRLTNDRVPKFLPVNRNFRWKEKENALCLYSQKSEKI